MWIISFLLSVSCDESIYVDLIIYENDKHVYGTDAWSDGMMKRTKTYTKILASMRTS